MFSNIKYTFFFIFIFIILTGYKKNIAPENMQSVSGSIVSQKLVGQLQISDIKNILGGLASELPSITQGSLNSFIANKIQYPVNVYSITYTTSLANGSPIIASGAIFCPQGTQALRIASYQHSTTADPDDVPSNYAKFNPIQFKGIESLLMALPFAANGYVVSCPDYIGLGSTYGQIESYVSKQSVTNTFDMLQATKSFISQKQISLKDNDIAIYGYSEGGYMSLGLHEMIESKTPWRVSLDFPGSGVYDLKNTWDSILKAQYIANYDYQGATWNFMGTFSLALYSLLTYYPVPATLNFTVAINQPYAHNLSSTSTVLWPTISGSMTNDTPSRFFTSNFIEGVKNNTSIFKAFNQLALSNSVYNWKPKYPVTLFAGSKDSFAFYSNADSAYNAIIRNGGNYINLDNNIPYLYPGVDHFTGFYVYLSYLYNKLAL